ncbi:MAG TPA: flagellar hook-basal body complex protein [Rhizomicrobium sp.]|nr:flagellar hook-basal body complex protein [Rhizomicrobium sp.]
MLGAIYNSLSGMGAFTKGLQTISNNVSNLNSSGFKAQTVSFGDLTDGERGGALRGGGTGDGGNGVRISDPITDFSQGDLQQTGNDLDLGIQGTGFLTVLNKDGGVFYTRTGSFAVDKDGFISDQTSGNRLAVIGDTGLPEAVNLNDKQTNPPVATTKVSFINNLSSSGTTATVSNMAVFDDQGGQQVWTATFTKSTTSSSPNSWDVAVADASGTSLGSGVISFIGSTPDPSASEIVIHNSPTGASPLSVTLDFSAVTSFSAGTASTLSAQPGDGVATGTLTKVGLDDAGQLVLTYSNEKTTKMGAIALADFQDPQSLKRLDQGLYSSLSGQGARLTVSGSEGVGTIKGKSIEASNVDLSRQFGSLIIIQRGFQACSQVLSVTNDMIQQLFSIRGQ